MIAASLILTFLMQVGTPVTPPAPVVPPKPQTVIVPPPTLTSPIAIYYCSPMPQFVSFIEALSLVDDAKVRAAITLLPGLVGLQTISKP